MRNQSCETKLLCLYIDILLMGREIRASADRQLRSMPLTWRPPGGQLIRRERTRSANKLDCAHKRDFEQLSRNRPIFVWRLLTCGTSRCMAETRACRREDILCVANGAALVITHMHHVFRPSGTSVQNRVRRDIEKVYSCPISTRTYTRMGKSAIFVDRCTEKK